MKSVLVVPVALMSWQGEPPAGISLGLPGSRESTNGGRLPHVYEAM